MRPQTGHLEYYLMEEGNQGQPIIGKHRGSQPLVGTNVIPSDEDSQAFSVVFASGKNAILPYFSHKLLYSLCYGNNAVL